MTSDMAGGYPTFVISIVMIGLVTALIGDIASQVGCTIGLKDSITAICIVALGTSVPGKMDHNSGKIAYENWHKRRKNVLFILMYHNISYCVAPF